MISKNKKVWNTQPERYFNEYQKSRGLGLIQNVTLPFTWEGQNLSFQCDFARPFDFATYAVTGFTLAGKYDIDFEIDGNQFHSSPRQQAKDKWKDTIKVATGLKVIHIPAEITKRKWWKYLDAELHRAISKPLGAYYIDA